MFESFLARRNLTVMRYDPVCCSKGHPVDRATIRRRLNEQKTSTFCEECGTSVELPTMAEPIQLSREAEAELATQRRAADQRTLFEQAVFRVQAYVESEDIRVPKCFISYAWGERGHERWVEKRLALDLQKAGLSVILDRWENSRTGSSIPRFIERITEVDQIIMVGTPLYREKYENKNEKTGYVVAAEVDLINNRLLGTEGQKETVLPLLLAGEAKKALPPLLQTRVHADFRDEKTYFITAFDLILDLYNINHRDQAVADLRESLEGRV